MILKDVKIYRILLAIAHFIFYHSINPLILGILIWLAPRYQTLKC